MVKNVLLIIFTIIPLSMESVIGTLFWRPRLAIDVSSRRAKIPASNSSDETTPKPITQQNINDGFVVVLDGYHAGINVLAIAKFLDQDLVFDYLNPSRASYYTNVYRWLLRHMSLYEDWFGGKIRGYPVTHQVWHKRFFYNDRLVPQWLQSLFPWVDKTDWKKEEINLKKFLKFAEPAFAKLQKYPSKHFNNFTSQMVSDD